MGLGKTVQITALLAAHFGLTGGEEDRDRKWKNKHLQGGDCEKAVLVVCPASVQSNWKIEITRWTHLNVEIATTGASVSDFVHQARNGQIDVLIMSYDRARLAIDRGILSGFSAASPIKDRRKAKRGVVVDAESDGSGDEFSMSMNVGAAAESDMFSESERPAHDPFSPAPWAMLVCDEVHEVRGNNNKVRCAVYLRLAFTGLGVIYVLCCVGAGILPAVLLQWN